MNLLRRTFRVASVSILLLAVAAAANAAEGSEALTRTTEIFKWINFAILAGLVYWVFAIVLPPKFRRRADEISSAVTKAAAAKAEADRQLQDAERRLAHLDEEVAALRAESAREAVAEAERIRALAQADARKVRDAARAEIAAAERAARNGLQQLTAKLAVDGAEALLTKQLTTQSQDALIASFLSHVSSQSRNAAGTRRPN